VRAPIPPQLPPPPALLDIDVGLAIQHVLKSHNRKFPLHCLGLTPGPETTDDAIRKQYHKLSLRLHPDKCTHERAQEAFNAIKEAYQKLAPTQ